MSAWAKPGAKCVYVDDSGPGVWSDDGPVVGQTYTVAMAWVDGDGDLIIDLVELKRSLKAQLVYAEYLGYLASRFRPLVTHTQERDVAIFLPLLNTVEEPA